MQSLIRRARQLVAPAADDRSGRDGSVSEVIPRISFVASIRDQGYGGGLLRRMNICLNALAAQAHRHRLHAEVILVVWNPAPGQPPLQEVLRLRESHEHLSVRIIVVPPELHRTLPNADRIPFFEPIGKNVGLRRARGEYWLATNPDLLFTDAVFRFLSNGLAPGHLYRMDRHEVGREVPGALSVRRQLAFCARHVAGVHTGYASMTFPRMVTVGRFRPVPRLQRQVERECRTPRPTERGDPQLYWLQGLYLANGIHTNASGCFLLMHRSHWESMHGHPEFYTRGHADSVATWAAMTQGLTQVVLQPPCFMFHQPHSRGEQGDWQYTDWRVWHARFEEHMRERQPLVINGSDWGFAGERLEEWVLQPTRGLPRWEKTRS